MSRKYLTADGYCDECCEYENEEGEGCPLCGKMRKPTRRTVKVAAVKSTAKPGKGKPIKPPEGGWTMPAAGKPLQMAGLCAGIHDAGPADTFCRRCGTNVKRACPGCKASMRPGDRFCGDCGRKAA